MEGLKGVNALTAYLIPPASLLTYYQKYNSPPVLLPLTNCPIPPHYKIEWYKECYALLAVSTIREHSDCQFGWWNRPECDSKSYETYKGKGKAGASLQAYIKHVKEKHNMNLKDFASLPCDPRLLKPSLELWFHEWQLICPSVPLHRSSNHEAIWLCTKRLTKNCCKYTCSLLVFITLEQVGISVEGIKMIEWMKFFKRCENIL